MNPIDINAQKLKKVQNELTNVYIKEQNQINKIRDSVEYRQSRIAWQTVNEVNRRKSTDGQRDAPSISLRNVTSE